MLKVRNISVGNPAVSGICLPVCPKALRAESAVFKREVPNVNSYNAL
jgi:hypothetical protein